MKTCNPSKYHWSYASKDTKGTVWMWATWGTQSLGLRSVRVVSRKKRSLGGVGSNCTVIFFIWSGCTKSSFSDTKQYYAVFILSSFQSAFFVQNAALFFFFLFLWSCLNYFPCVLVASLSCIHVLSAVIKAKCIFWGWVINDSVQQPPSLVLCLLLPCNYSLFQCPFSFVFWFLCEFLLQKPPWWDFNTSRDFLL